MDTLRIAFLNMIGITVHDREMPQEENETMMNNEN